MQRRVEWNAKDFAAVFLAVQGYTNFCILGRTELTPGKVTYRLKQLALSGERRAYRNGESLLAKAALRRANKDATTLVERAVGRLKDKTDPARKRGRAA